MKNNREDEQVIRKSTAQASDSSGFQIILENLTVFLKRVVSTLNKSVHFVSQIVLFFVMCLTFLDIVGRNLFNNPIKGTFELTGLSLVIIVFLSLGITQWKKEHIEIDFFFDKFPEKVQQVLATITYFILLIFLIVVTWKMVGYVGTVFLSNEESNDLRIPIYYFTIIASIGMVVFTMNFLYDFFKSLLKVVQRNGS